MNLKSFINKIRDKGPLWCIQRLSLEFSYTAIWVVQLLFTFLFFFRRKTLVAYYDLDFCPASYDAAWYFIAAEVEMRKRKCKKMEVVFYPRQSRKSGNYGIMADEQGQVWRFENIVIPITTLFPCVNAYSVYFSKWASMLAVKLSPHVFPYRPLSPFRYKADFISIFRNTFNELTRTEKRWGLKASVAAKRYVQLWVNNNSQGRKLIVITLRCSPFAPKRNSKISEWAQFAKSCDPTHFHIVFVMDTDTLFKGYPNELKSFTFFDAASWNLGMRAALYEEAYLCLGTFIGPGGLWMLNNQCRYISFKVATQGEPSASEQVMIRLGFVKGKNVPWAGPFQKIIWEDDDFPTIEREFKLMCEKIDLFLDNKCLLNEGK